MLSPLVWESSHYDDVVAFLVFKFGVGLVHPVSPTKEYVVWRNARRVKLVKTQVREYLKGVSEMGHMAHKYPGKTQGANRPLQIVCETHVCACE